ncbi:hypothetical protein GE061_013346 [Apolygus lucorum]|uniref:Oxidoreductase-like domain-containing protein n=1 Tax=Apolygus lucorum TaxID=248454 RepID=A0A8S9XMF1_APOLU|nr:hypothetical protein GE061_013346 [Apolygus lucorum]
MPCATHPSGGNSEGLTGTYPSSRRRRIRRSGDCSIAGGALGGRSRGKLSRSARTVEEGASSPPATFGECLEVISFLNNLKKSRSWFLRVAENFKNFTLNCAAGESHDSSCNGDRKGESNVCLPGPPVDCCMSGCENCVWIRYAEELTKILKDDGRKAREIVLQQVRDPSMRAFLDLELKIMYGDQDDDK